ncbi:MAG: FkbM family methyltransferase [Ferruginibacter sp.]
MYYSILKFYRKLPLFKGKFRLGHMLFKKLINKDESISFRAHDNIIYQIPNTKENIGKELLINGRYESEIVSFLKKIVNDGAVYFDIGANIGTIGLPVIMKRSNVRYYGFEASPVVFKYLQANFKANCITNYHLYNNLVHSDDNQSMKFYQAELYGKSSLAPTYSQDYVFVNSVSLDGFCKAHNIFHVDVIKIDVQGFELNVFQGMRELLLNRQVAHILFEFEGWAEEQARLPIAAAQEYLLSLNYELFDLEGNKIAGILTTGSNMIWAKPASLK